METPQEEFREMQTEITDEDPIVRGMAAVDLGSFACEHPEYKDQAIALLEKSVNDPDEDVRTSATRSLEMIAGKKMIEAEEGKQIIGFGYLPEEYQRPETGSKQSLMSCVCCIALILILSISLIYLF
jgi:hypothetical protein